MFLSVCVFDDKLAKVTHRRSVYVPPTSGQTSARVFLSADDANLLPSDQREPSASRRGNGAINGCSSRLRISLAAADTPPEVSSRWWRGASPAAHLRAMNFIIFSPGGAIFAGWSSWLLLAAAYARRYVHFSCFTGGRCFQKTSGDSVGVRGWGGSRWRKPSGRSSILHSATAFLPSPSTVLPPLYYGLFSSTSLHLHQLGRFPPCSHLL